MIQMKVPDMTCSHCVDTIRKAVAGVDSLAHCEIDLGSGSVSVESGLPPSDFVEALEEAGYRPELLRAMG